MSAKRFCLYKFGDTASTTGDQLLPTGIELNRFLKNPVMFYGHNSGGDPQDVVGRWENIAFEIDGLYADADFDMSSEKGRAVAEKVKNGYIKGASLGILPKERKEKTITKCEVYEASVVDVPAMQRSLRLSADPNLLFFQSNLSKPVTMSEQKPQTTFSAPTSPTGTAFPQPTAPATPGVTAEQYSLLQKHLQASEEARKADSQTFAQQTELQNKEIQALKENQKATLEAMQKQFEVMKDLPSKGAKQEFSVEQVFQMAFTGKDLEGKPLSEAKCREFADLSDKNMEEGKLDGTGQSRHSLTGLDPEQKDA